MDRIDLYLHQNIGSTYLNSDKETELVNKFHALYIHAKGVHEATAEANPKNLEMWRKAYKGTLNALDSDGSESQRKSRQLRKLAFEIVESKIDNGIPMPKITPRYKSDLTLVDITENYLKFEMDRVITKYQNDRGERATYVDGTVWYKVWWDSLDNTHERSGNVKIDLCTVDQVIPQPGVIDYKQLEYIFERKRVSVTRLYDTYNRLITPNDGNMVDVVYCYYLNENRIVGLFAWAENTLQVICNEKDWQIRKLRHCTKCDAVEPSGEVCSVCGGKHFKYKNATTEILSEDLEIMYNPYEVGETDDPKERNHFVSKKFLSAGSEIPFYHIDQLPFIPRPAISMVDSIYGISEVRMVLEMQDVANKMLTKAVDKTMKSGTVVTKPNTAKMNDNDATFKIVNVKSPEEAQMFQAKQVLADTSGDLTMAAMLYDSAKSSSGVTDSFQGKRDTTATSGKAKQYAAAQSAGRIESLRVMKSAAFSGLYELVLKYLLAFSDEPREFVKTLPDGSEQEMVWNKYMFLDKDKNDNVYYRDDFHFNSDPAATLSQNRVQLWQETQDKFINGALGNPQDPRVLKMFWNMMASFQYPLAKTVIAGITEGEHHLSPEIEQALMNNPAALQAAMEVIQEGQEHRGGARPNSGPAGNGATHSANVERTNERNRATNRQPVVSAQQAGGIV
jgi:hypothetical protein